MITRLFSAIPMGENPSQSFELTWPALGIYFHLRKSKQAQSVKHLQTSGYRIDSYAIALAINELLDAGLLTEQIVEEVGA